VDRGGVKKGEKELKREESKKQGAGSD